MKVSIQTGCVFLLILLLSACVTNREYRVSQYNVDFYQRQADSLKKVYPVQLENLQKTLLVMSEDAARQDTIKHNDRIRYDSLSRVVRALSDSINTLNNALLSRDTALSKKGQKEAVAINKLKTTVKELSRQLEICKSDTISAPVKNTGRRAEKTEFNHQQYVIYRIHPKHETIKTFWKDNQGQNLHSLGNVKSLVESTGKKLLFATNAGIFKPDFVPEGLYVENGQKRVEVNTAKGDGNFYLQPNGLFLITGKKARVISTAEYNPGEAVTFGTQSGPMLISNGKINGQFTQGSPNTNVRSGVGVNSKGEVVFAISEQPVNFYDFALFFQSMDCKNALYLDGVISKAYVPELNMKDTGGNFGAIIGVVE